VFEESESNGADAMTTTVTLPPEPVLYLLWYRPPGKRQRWHRAGRFSARAEAIAAIGGKGDWHVAPLFNPDLAGDGLFATSEPAEPTAAGQP
jgi:hypothetical protein